MTTITILSTGLDPAIAPQLTQGQTVNFKLGEGVEETDIYFDDPSRLKHSPNPLHVTADGASVTIAANAPKGRINYGKHPLEGQDSSKGSPKGGGEVLTGGLDVTTEPPTPPED